MSETIKALKVECRKAARELDYTAAGCAEYSQWVQQLHAALGAEAKRVKSATQSADNPASPILRSLNVEEKDTLPPGNMSGTQRKIEDAKVKEKAIRELKKKLADATELYDAAKAQRAEGERVCREKKLEIEKIKSQLVELM